ncbi:uncharacterized protein LOC122663264 [Telopea speciosissima]|uniref:uncharacterized protein LOC122663264 n=1 Tax=Telopea speciosissima TaxID=54955 RepID=UPI001CC4814B|nr:uncharacterized protein LOC122663264 [Telopea speciosissima]
MGDLLSTPSASMSSSESYSAKNVSPSDTSPSTPSTIADDQNQEVSDHSNVSTSEENGDEEEDGECGFCLFMKGGGCRDEFIAWENCIEAAEKKEEDIVEKCFEVTGLLKKCMEAHSDYYEPVLKAEKAVEEEASKEMDQETSAKQ